jgi:hypothetical protein
MASTWIEKSCVICIDTSIIDYQEKDKIQINGLVSCLVGIATQVIARFTSYSPCSITTAPHQNGKLQEHSNTLGCYASAPLLTTFGKDVILNSFEGVSQKAVTTQNSLDTSYQG